MSSEDFTIEMPFGPPPILPNIGQQFEEYLTRPEKLPLHNNKTDFKFWNRKIDHSSLYQTELSPAITTLKIRRDVDTSELFDFYEAPIEGVGETNKNSTSFTRPPGNITDDIRGSRINYPFWPGGIDLPTLTENDEKFDILDNSELLTTAPGLSRGIDFKSKVAKPMAEECASNLEIIDFQKIMEDFGDLSISSLENKNKSVETEHQSHELEALVVPKEVKIPILKISEDCNKTVMKTEWAEMLDTTKPVVNFDKKIPDPAVKFNFELDTFQKMAILKLEDHKHIFVAAHTSAGKTVVAEYAIGLSQKHCTKTVYTSPIKALSNQKYRDFKEKFTDVGLITGDFQVNQQASCLIMTTEILRSMLYCGSDVIRDIEFVIFDEVHYINDSERGHVWEEILIMLPDTVCIVMLSATVPNVLEFADWVGRTKRAKMFVVNTLKRPVPLQHYLYTGIDDENEKVFLIMDGDGPFIQNGYNRAAATLEKTKQVNAKSGKSKVITQKLQPLKGTSEKPYWIAFAKYLKKNDKLPAVAFTLSRNKCDRYAELLKTVDLTDQREKNAIKQYFKKCIDSLKEEDRDLPQILRMETLLENGIAVHHSGILPILKEIVEILFQKSLVKFLFATETFAMGVNMPAKTVAFDSITKYDGSSFRCLQSAEYIQMAGRAGRRGQDATGTVIILCKHSVEEAGKIRDMMTGVPMKLESQFRMTYSMILNLLRVKGLRVEDIMAHSFKELHSRRKLAEYKKELADLENNEEEDNIRNKPFFNKLEEFYDAADRFIDLWNTFGLKFCTCPKLQKELVVGRLIVVTHKEHINKLALILQVISKRDVVEYKIIFLQEETEDSWDEKESDLFYRMIGLAQKMIYVPTAKTKEIVMLINAQSIVAITKYSLKVECDLVLQDCEKRQIPRFKNDPPGKSCLRTLSELSEKSHFIVNNGGFRKDHFVSMEDVKINDVELNEKKKNLFRAKQLVDAFNLSSEVSNFHAQFKEVFALKLKETRKKKLEFMLSPASLVLYEDYQNKVNVLRRLGYIDQEDIVQLKGKVACEMGSNELIITELIFQNILTKFEPAEIAALLSSLVFQVRTEDDAVSELSPILKQGVETLTEVYNDIRNAENSYDDVVSLNFGLVQVVYEWAHGKAFSAIMELVEGKVQEGIIVRCIQQLNEILHDIKGAARLFGDLVLKKKMEEASDAIQRDIVFAASLYTQ